MSIVKQLLGEADFGYDGVVYPAVVVRPTAKSEMFRRSPKPGSQKVVELSFPGNSSTIVVGITPEAATKLIADLQAAASSGGEKPQWPKEVKSPAGSPPGSAHPDTPTDDDDNEA